MEIRQKARTANKGFTQVTCQRYEPTHNSHKRKAPNR